MTDDAAAHCFTSQGARNAIEGGIGGIEHGNLIDVPTLKLMAEKGVHLTPTLIVCDVSGLCLLRPHRLTSSFSPARRSKR